jgi:cation transport regulator ChaB
MTETEALKEFEKWYKSKFDAPEEVKQTFQYLMHNLLAKEVWLAAWRKYGEVEG